VKPTLEQIQKGLKKKELRGVATGLAPKLPPGPSKIIAQLAATGKKTGGKKTRKAKKSVKRRRTAKRSF
jgi:hypothetical protein